MMTTGTGPDTEPPAHPAPEDASSGPADSPTVVRRRRVEGRQHRLTVWQAVLSGVFVVAFAALGLVGYRASLRIGGGSDDRITDPEAPGYVAEPKRSAVDLYVVTDQDGAFASALLVVPDSSGAGGTLVPVPPSLVLPEIEGAPPVFVADVFAQSGLEGVRERLGLGLGFRIGSAEVVSPEALAELTGGQDIVIDNVDNLIERAPDGTETLKYPAGELPITPEELTGFLAFQGADDPAPNQALRAQLVWEQLLAGAGGVDLTSLPDGERTEGSQSPGFGETLGGLLAGNQRYDSVPMDTVPVPNSYLVAWMPDPEALNAFVARVVPLPESPAPGIRVPVALLDGTGDPDVLPPAIPMIVRSGGEVTQVGNAESFEVPISRVEYSGEEFAEVAQRIASELGVTATAGAEPVEGASIDVVIGADRAG
jgi:hypothetical protein